MGFFDRIPGGMKEAKNMPLSPCIWIKMRAKVKMQQRASGSIPETQCPFQFSGSYFFSNWNRFRFGTPENRISLNIQINYLKLLLANK